jgi:hypothetical protein
MRVGLHVKYSLSFQILVKLDFFRHIFEKFSHNNFHEIRAMGAELSMRTNGRTDGQRGMTKLIVAFRNFSNAPKSYT